MNLLILTSYENLVKSDYNLIVYLFYYQSQLLIVSVETLTPFSFCSMIVDVTTSYTLDLTAGRTQILSDGSTTFLSGYGWVGEYTDGEWADDTTDDDH
jgi:hypothetical protein